MDIPVYIFTGFLESGKTQFMREILSDKDFTEGERSLLLLCEDGIEELEQAELHTWNTVCVPIDSAEQLNPNALALLEKKFTPDRVLIEFNGMWQLELLNTALPQNWKIYQVVTTVNAQTFELYAGNIGAQMLGHITAADLIVFNRCTDALKQMLYRRNIRAMNPRATIFLDDVDGSSEDYVKNMPMPFDLDADVIEISDKDFGLWYIDAVSESRKYEGKTVSIRGQVLRSEQTPKGTFIPGRRAMVCCADDITFVGFLCRFAQAEQLPLRGWVQVTAKISVESLPQYRGEAPVLNAVSVKSACQPEEEIVYFN